MKFKNLKISNFSTIKSLEFDLSNKGLVLVLGLNKDTTKSISNGAGKSTLLDAVLWCLWGMTSHEVSHDDVVNDQIGQDCFVEVEIVEEDTVYLVKRCRLNKIDVSLKPNDLLLYKDGIDVSGVSMSDTQLLINDVLGLDFVTFCSLMGVGQRPASMTDKDIKQLLEKLLQTEVLGKAQLNVREQKKEVELNLRGLQATESTLKNSLQESEQRFLEYKENFNNFEFKKAENLKSVNNSIFEAEKTLSDLEAFLSSYVDIEDKIKLTKVKLKEIDRNVETAKAELNSHYTLYNIGLNNYKSQKAVLESKIATLEEEKTKISSIGGECAHCAQRVDDSHKLNLIRLKLDLQSSLNNELNVLESKIHEVISSFSKIKQDCEDELQELTNTGSLLNKDLTRFELIKKECEINKGHQKTWNLNLMALQSSYEDKKKEANPFKELMDKEFLVKKKKKEELKQLKTEIDGLTSKLEVLSFWLDGFSPSGLRSYMLETVTPILNASAKKYCKLLTDDEMTIEFETKETLKNGKTVEKFNIKVSQKHGGCKYAKNSLGEKARANLVISFVLSDLAEMRSNKQISFRFFDEPFEHIDEAGIESVVALLKDQEKLYESVFVVTHNESFKQYFNNSILMVKENGFSFLEENYE